MAAPAALADVLEPYDGLPGDPWGGALLLYPAYWRYPTYKDSEAGDVRVDASTRAAAVKGGLFLPKIAGKYDWGLTFSLPYLEIDGDGLKKQAGMGDPALPAMEARSAWRVVPDRGRCVRIAAVAKGPEVLEPQRRYASTSDTPSSHSS